MHRKRFSPEAFPHLHPDGEYAKRLNQTTDLARNIRKANRDSLRVEFLELAECAPRRADAGKGYFEKHDGIPSSGVRAILWSERILEMALWNEKQSWPHATEDEFCLLDYQVPLYARRSDQNVGEVDLLGITTRRRLMVIELKVKPDGVNNRGHTPAAALLQGLRYTAIVQSNQETIAREIERKFNRSVLEEPPIVQVLAPENWWQTWMGLSGSTRHAAGNWGIAFAKLAKDIEEQIGIAIECATLDIRRGAIWLDKNGRPRLKRSPELRFLDHHPANNDGNWGVGK